MRAVSVRYWVDNPFTLTLKPGNIDTHQVLDLKNVLA